MLPDHLVHFAKSAGNFHVPPDILHFYWALNLGHEQIGVLVISREMYPTEKP